MAVAKDTALQAAAMSAGAGKRQVLTAGPISGPRYGSCCTSIGESQVPGSAAAGGLGEGTGEGLGTGEGEGEGLGEGEGEGLGEGEGTTGGTTGDGEGAWGAGGGAPATGRHSG